MCVQHRPQCLVCWILLVSVSTVGTRGLGPTAGDGQSWDWDPGAWPLHLLCSPELPGVWEVPEVLGGTDTWWHRSRGDQESRGRHRPVWLQQPGQGDESLVRLGPASRSRTGHALPWGHSGHQSLEQLSDMIEPGLVWPGAPLLCGAGPCRGGQTCGGFMETPAGGLLGWGSEGSRRRAQARWLCVRW